MPDAPPPALPRNAVLAIAVGSALVTFAVLFFALRGALGDTSAMLVGALVGIGESVLLSRLLAKARAPP